MRLRLLAALLLLVACTARPGNNESFDAWLRGDATRSAAFKRFSELMAEEGVADVVPLHELWMVDRLRPECSASPFAVPAETRWSNIVPALRFIRDHVEPTIGSVRVVSAFRDDAFNACIGGAPASAHRSYHALDLVPLDHAVTREVLIERLCALHASEGPANDVGLGIYSGVRFHIDARSYRGWGGDHRAGSFPCQTGPPD